MEETQKKAQLLILADDLTGALDSGVQLTRKGLEVIILPDCTAGIHISGTAEVYVADTESRHVSPEAAGEQIRSLVKEAKKSGIPRIYKKIDSGLRGNVGAELEALAESADAERIHFIPAYPNADRLTRNGIQYVNGKPLSKSIFSKDPMDPMTVDRVDEVIHQQSNMPVRNIPRGSAGEAGFEGYHGILVYDAETGEDLREIAELLEKQRELRYSAGCAGFLEVYPFGKREGMACELPKLPTRLTVLSGSVNAVTREQLDRAEAAGAVRCHIPMDALLQGSWTPEKKLQFAKEALQAFGDSPIGLIDTLGTCTEKPSESPEGLGARIAGHMGELIRSMLLLDEDRLLMIIGGDTLQGFINVLGIKSLKPIAEAAPGIVLAEFTYEGKTRYIITKSGAFGVSDQLVILQKWLEQLAVKAEPIMQ